MDKVVELVVIAIFAGVIVAAVWEELKTVYGSLSLRGRLVGIGIALVLTSGFAFFSEHIPRLTNVLINIPVPTLVVRPIQVDHSLSLGAVWLLILMTLLILHGVSSRRSIYPQFDTIFGVIVFLLVPYSFIVEESKTSLYHTIPMSNYIFLFICGAIVAFSPPISPQVAAGKVIIMSKLIVALVILMESYFTLFQTFQFGSY